MCSSLITDQLITAVGYRCKVRKDGIHAKQSLLYNEKCNAEIIIFFQVIVILRDREGQEGYSRDP